MKRKMEGFASHGLFGHAATLLTMALPENSSAVSFEISPYLVQLLLRLLSLMARYSVTACNELIDLGILSVIQSLLGSPSDRLDAFSSSPCHSRPRSSSLPQESPPRTSRRRSRSLSCGSPADVAADDTLFRTLNLLDSLLPDLPIELHPLVGGKTVHTPSGFTGS